MSRPKKLPKVLTPDEQRALVARPNPRYLTGLRNRCIIRIMLEAGLRSGELVALRPEHLDMRTCRLNVREGKGAKDRTLWISDDLRDLIGRWLERRPQSEWLFCTRDGGQMSTRYLRQMVKRYAVKAGVSEAQRSDTCTPEGYLQNFRDATAPPRKASSLGSTPSCRRTSSSFPTTR